MDADAAFPERASPAEWAQVWIMLALVIAIMLFGKSAPHRD